MITEFCINQIRKLEISGQLTLSQYTSYNYHYQEPEPKTMERYNAGQFGCALHHSHVEHNTSWLW